MDTLGELLRSIAHPIKSDYVSPSHPDLHTEYPGVRQDHDGRLFRNGMMKDGRSVKVEHNDSRVFGFTEGTFTGNSIHATVDGKRI